MLYTLVGNGSFNAKEVTASLDTLVAAASNPDDQFWMLVRGETAPSDTIQAIMAWADKANVYYEVVWSSEDFEEVEQLPAIYASGENFFKSRRVLDRMVKLSKERLNPDEKAVALVLDNSLYGEEPDNDILYVIDAFITDGVEVFDLGAQMTPLVFDDDETVEINPEPAPQAEPQLPMNITDGEPDEEEPEQTPDEPEPWPLPTQAELEDMSRAQLKEIATKLGVLDYVTDQRSKDAYVAAIMGHISPSDAAIDQAAEEPVYEPGEPQEPEEQPKDAKYGGVVQADVVGPSTWLLLEIKPDGTVRGHAVNPVNISELLNGVF